MDPHSRPPRSRVWGVWPGWIPSATDPDPDVEDRRRSRDRSRSRDRNHTTHRRDIHVNPEVRSAGDVRPRLPSYQRQPTIRFVPRPSPDKGDQGADQRLPPTRFNEQRTTTSATAPQAVRLTPHSRAASAQPTTVSHSEAMSSLPAPPLEIADAHHLGHTQTNPRPWDAETTGDCERELGKTRQAYPSSTQRKAAAVRTRSCIDQTTSEGGFANRRDDLQRDANATLTWVRAPQTDTGYITALNWWRKFSRFIGMSSPYLAFDSDNGAARAQVTNRALMFLQFTSRTIRPKRGEVPDPNTSYRYLSMVVKMHYEGGTDIHFVLPT